MDDTAKDFSFSIDRRAAIRAASLRFATGTEEAPPLVNITDKDTPDTAWEKQKTYLESIETLLESMFSAADEVAKLIRNWKPGEGANGIRVNPSDDPEWSNKAAASQSMFFTHQIQVGAHSRKGSYSHWIDAAYGDEAKGASPAYLLLFALMQKDNSPFFKNLTESLKAFFVSILADSYDPMGESRPDPYQGLCQHLWIMWFYYAFMGSDLDGVEVGALFKIDYAFSRLMNFAWAAQTAFFKKGTEKDDARKGRETISKGIRDRKERIVDTVDTIRKRTGLKRFYTKKDGRLKPHSLAKAVRGEWKEGYGDDPVTAEVLAEDIGNLVKEDKIPLYLPD
jgi:hypothetical protein